MAVVDGFTKDHLRQWCKNQERDWPRLYRNILRFLEQQTSDELDHLLNLGWPKVRERVES